MRNTINELLKGLFLIMGVIAISCTKDNQTDMGSLYTPSVSDTTATASLEELQQGRALYIENCGSCHGLFSPDNYSVSQWQGIMDNMAPETNLTAPETILVTKYLTRGH